LERLKRNNGENNWGTRNVKCPLKGVVKEAYISSEKKVLGEKCGDRKHFGGRGGEFREKYSVRGQLIHSQSLM